MSTAPLGADTHVHAFGPLAEDGRQSSPAVRVQGTGWSWVGGASVGPRGVLAGKV